MRSSIRKGDKNHFKRKLIHEQINGFGNGMRKKNSKSNVRHRKLMTVDSIGLILCTLILFAFK